MNVYHQRRNLWRSFLIFIALTFCSWLVFAAVGLVTVNFCHSSNLQSYRSDAAFQQQINQIIATRFAKMEIDHAVPKVIFDMALTEGFLAGGSVAALSLIVSLIFLLRHKLWPSPCRSEFPQ